MSKKVRVFQALGAASMVDPARREIEVFLISAGEGNDYFFPADKIAKAAPLFEGCQAYADHDESMKKYGRSIRNLVGYYRDVKPTPDGQALRAVLCLEDSPFGLEVFGKLQHAIKYQEENPGSDRVYCGLSMQAFITVIPGEVAGRKLDVVTEITDILSVDIVTEPARGGKAIQILTSRRQNKEDGMDKIIKLKALINALMTTVYNDTEKLFLQQMLTILAELEAELEPEEPGEPDAGEGDPPAPPPEAQAPTPPAAEVMAGQSKDPQLEARLREANRQLSEVSGNYRKALARLAEMESKEYAVKKLRESKLPGDVHELLLAKLKGKPQADIDAEIGLHVKMAERLRAQGTPVSGVPERFSQQSEEMNIFADCRHDD